MTDTMEPTDEAKEFVETYFRKVKYGLLEDDDFDYIGGTWDKEQWHKTKELLEIEEAKRRERWLVHENRKHTEDRLADQLLDGLIEKHLPKADWKEKAFFKQEIKEEFEKYDSYDLDPATNYIRELLKSGLQGIRHRRRASKHYWKRSFRHGWTVVKNIIAVVLALIIYDAASTKFETFAFSLLILIYLRVVLFSSAWTIQNSQNLLALDREFKRLRRLLGDKETHDERDVVIEGRKRVDMDLVDLYITGGFGSLLFLIVLSRIYSVVFWLLHVNSAILTQPSGRLSASLI